MAILLLTVSTGCGKSSEADEVPSATIGSAPRSTTSTTTEPPEVQLTPEEEVEAAYLEAELRFLAFMEDPNGSDAFLSETRTAEAFTYASETVVKRRDSGHVTRYPSGYTKSDVLLVEVSGDEAKVIACMHDDAIVVSSDGDVVNDSVSTVLFDVEMKHESRSWKVSSQVATKVQDGIVSCENM